LKDISCCALTTSRNDFLIMIIIVVLIISMNIIVITTRKYQKWWWWREPQRFASLKRDSKQSSSFEQTEQDLPKYWHCKILLQAGPRPDKPEFTKKSIRLKKLDNYRRKWKKVAEHLLRLWVSSICVLQWVWKMSFHRKKDKIYKFTWHAGRQVVPPVIWGFFLKLRFRIFSDIWDKIDEFSSF